MWTKGARSPRRAGRILLASGCVVGLAVVFATVVNQVRVANSAAARVVELELQGAALLHPMTTLLDQLVQAQSAAVRGEQVDRESVRNALAAAAAEDARYGEALQSRQRLSDLAEQVEAALAQPLSGRWAYDTYSGLVGLAVDLMRRISDTSHLVHDPELDSYYLMDAAIVRLPEAMVLAGRATDLVALAGGGDLEGEDAVKAAVARYGVSAAAEQVSAGLTKSVDYTARSELGSRIAERLDAFKAAADEFAPPTMLAELSGTVTAEELAANAQRVYAAATPLAHRLLSELEALLQVRAERLAAEWRVTVVGATLFGVLVLPLMWIAIASGRQTTPAAAKAGSGGDVSVGTLTHARDLVGRDLVGTEELVHARGRGSMDAR